MGASLTTVGPARRAGRDRVVRHLGADDRSSTRVRIVDGALRCLARQGVAKTTVDDIAREAGLSRATLYRTFPGGRDAVLGAVVETEAARLTSALAVVMGEAKDLEDVLVAGMVEAARRLRTHAALAYVLTHEPGVILPHLTFAELDRILLVAGDTGRTVLRSLAPARTGLARGRVGGAHRAGLQLRTSAHGRPDRPGGVPCARARFRPAGHPRPSRQPSEPDTTKTTTITTSPPRGHCHDDTRPRSGPAAVQPGTDRPRQDQRPRSGAQRRRSLRR